MNSLFQLEIPKRGMHCMHHGERFLPGMEIYSLLLEDEVNGLVRRDFCSACWTQVQAEERKLILRLYWKSKIEQRKPPVESSRTSRALTLLRELLQASESQEQEAEIFVLCLFLSHARQLALRQEFEKEGFTYQLYEVLRQEDYLTIKMIHLSQLQIDAIQKSLACKLT